MTTHNTNRKGKTNVGASAQGMAVALGQGNRCVALGRSISFAKMNLAEEAHLRIATEGKTNVRSP